MPPAPAALDGAMAATPLPPPLPPSHAPKLRMSRCRHSAPRCPRLQTNERRPTNPPPLAMNSFLPPSHIAAGRVEVGQAATLIICLPFEEPPSPYSPLHYSPASRNIP